MKTALIFTGGTIGSARTNGRIAPAEQAAAALRAMIGQRYAHLGEFTTVSPYTVLSENLCAKHLNALIDCVREQTAHGAQAAVIFHGTDTLAYTAAALACAFGNDSIPIVLVSANYPANDARSNARANLCGALDFLAQADGARGVFAVYKNENGPVLVHRGTRILEQNAFEDAVYSAAGQYFGRFDKNGSFQKNPAYRESEDEMPAFESLHFCSSSAVWRLLPCPGMPLPQPDGRVKAVVLDSFHSGSTATACAPLQSFCQKAQGKGIEVFLSGQKSDYESAAALQALHIRALERLTPVCAYVKAWAICSTDGDWSKMMRSLGGDRICF